MRGMQWGLAVALLREVHLHRYAAQARNAQAGNWWIVEPASTFEVFLTTIISRYRDNSCRRGNTGFAVWIPVAGPSSLHSTIAFDLRG